MNINEHDKKEIKGCMKLLETIKDKSRDYVGTNGCLYQDITREELDLIVNEIERLNNIINRAIVYIETGKTFPSDETRETVEYMQNILLDILKGSDNK